MADKGSSQAVNRREHITDKEVKRVIGVDPFGGLQTEGNFTTLIDKVSSVLTYVGSAQLGTATNLAKWQIIKITKTGGLTEVKWAGGSDDFVKIWDNRVSYIYS